jgi:hypothetical protein
MAKTNRQPEPAQPPAASAAAEEITSGYCRPAPGEEPLPDPVMVHLPPAGTPDEQAARLAEKMIGLPHPDARVLELAKRIVSAGQEAPPFDAKGLIRVGQGFWTYRHQGDPAGPQQPGFFKEAFRRFGMREGDVICVNAAPFGVGLMSAENNG